MAETAALVHFLRPPVALILRWSTTVDFVSDVGYYDIKFLCAIDLQKMRNLLMLTEFVVIVSDLP